MKNKIIFYCLGLLTAACLFSVIKLSNADNRFYNSLPELGFINKAAKIIVNIEQEDLSKNNQIHEYEIALNNILMSAINEKYYSMADCFERLGFKDLKNLYVYIRSDNTINNLDDYIYEADIKKIFKERFSNFNITFLNDYNNRPWIKDKENYGVVQIRFGILNKNNFKIETPLELLETNITFRRSGHKLSSSSKSFVTPITNNENASLWFKDKVIRDFAFYQAAYMTFSCH